MSNWLCAFTATGHRAASGLLVEDPVSDPVVRNVKSETKVPMAISQRSMCDLQGRTFDHLSESSAEGQNTKVV
jgi:hypothetical protein